MFNETVIFQFIVSAAGIWAAGFAAGKAAAWVRGIGSAAN